MKVPVHLRHVEVVGDGVIGRSLPKSMPAEIRAKVLDKLAGRSVKHNVVVNSEDEADADADIRLRVKLASIALL
jgi:hypothetical protein